MGYLPVQQHIVCVNRAAAVADPVYRKCLTMAKTGKYSNHVYTTLDGRALPSVTTIIGDIMPNGWKKGWQNKQTRAGKCHKTELDRYSKVGTLVHLRVLQQIAGVSLPLPEFPFSEYPKDIEEYCDVAEDMWCQVTDKIGKPRRPILVEQLVVDEVAGFNGTYDLKCMVGGMPTIIDIKTSKEARDSHFIQLGAYALPQLHDTDIPKQGWVVSLCPYSDVNPTLEPKIYPMDSLELKTKGNEFLNMCRKWHKAHAGE